MARLGLTAIAAAAAATVLALNSPAPPVAAGPAAMVLSPATTGPSGPLKTVTYRGYAFSVPAAWPVVRTTRTSATCVRFDRHAIYLGDPGQDQHCPAGLLGTTEAVLVQPATGQARPAAEDRTARQITVRSPGIVVTATYDTNRPLVLRILASASLPLPGAGSGRAANAARASLAPPAAAPTLPAGATSYTGQGFDACAAPSAAYMSAWQGASPYGAIGVYIGGADRACAQPNLTAAWVSQQAALGWHFLPVYAGVQGEFGQITSPVSQGVAAAQDAVTQAAALGFGPGTPLYYDMEAYPPAQQGNVLSFLSAWTTQLHVEGYRSAVYSSSSSGITDLAGHTTGDAMPDVIWDALWNGDASTADPVLPPAGWAAHQRVHQYSGSVNASYGGDALAIDQDYLDVSVPPLPAEPAGPALVTRGGTVDDFVIRADRNLYAYDQAGPGGGFASPKKLTTAGGLTGPPVAVQDQAGTVWVFARTTGGLVRVIWQAVPGGAFNRSATFSGRMAASPAAIVTQNGTVALYAIGTNGQLCTWTQATPGGPFTGPARMTANGGLTGTPAAVQAPDGAISVYARTVTGAVRAKGQPAAGRPFSSSANLGGHVAASPAAIVAQNGTVALYAIGTNGQLYTWTQATPGGPMTGPARMTANGGLTGTPVAAMNGSGAVSVYTRTVTGAVRARWQSAPGGAFGNNANLGGHIAAAMAALAADNDTIALYATGTDGRQYGAGEAAAGGAFGGWTVI